MSGPSSFSPVQIVLTIVIIFGLVFAYFIGNAIAREQYYLLLALTVLIGTISWTVVGRNIWWVPMFFFSALGGFFYFGFKLHVHEIGLVITLIPLILLIAINRPDVQIRKHFSQGIVVILFIYLCLHLLGCLIYLKFYEMPGMTNVLRRYMEAMWPILFLIPFLFFGSTRCLPFAMFLMFLGSIIRVALGLYTVLRGGGNNDGIGETIFVPLINFVPAGANIGADLRYSGPALISMSIVYFCLYKNFLARFCSAFMIMVGTAASFLGGGRIIFVVTFILLIFPLLIYRKTYLILLTAALFLIGVLVVNANPDVLYQLPDSARRASTAILFNRSTAAMIGNTGSSDDWHKVLNQEGFKTWTSNAFTIFLGRGSRGFDERSWSSQERFWSMVEMAIATGRFEKGLWDTLTTFGLVGFVLFCICMITIIIKCYRVLIRRKITSYPLGLAFIGLFQCFTWFVFCGIGGTFPSLAVMIGLVALIAIEDEENAKSEATSLASSPITDSKLNLSTT